MKRIIMIALIGAVCAGALSAQCWGPGWGWGPMPPMGPGRMRQNRQLPPNMEQRNWQNRRSSTPAPETITISGALQLIKGRIAMVYQGKTYYIAGLSRLVGFIDGLKEGAQVTLEGNAASLRGNTETLFFRVSKLTINGKEYGDLSPSSPGK